MVNYRVLFLGLVLIISQAAFAGSFTATVDKDKAVLNEDIHLRLDLSGLQPNERPDFSPLENSFEIHSQEQSSMMSTVNGKSSASTSWDLSLLPKQSGRIVLPPITISTSQGEMETERARRLTMAIEGALYSIGASGRETDHGTAETDIIHLRREADTLLLRKTSRDFTSGHISGLPQLNPS